MEGAFITGIFCLIYGFSCSPLYVERLQQDMMKNISTNSCKKIKGIYDNVPKKCSCPSNRPDLTRDKDNILSCRSLAAEDCRYNYRDSITLKEIEHLISNCSGSHYLLSEEGDWSNQTKKFRSTASKQLNQQSNDSDWLSGQIIKYQCAELCIIVKVKGSFVYEIKPSTSEHDSSPIVSTEKPSTVHHSWVKLGVIAAIIVIMIVICTTIVVVVASMQQASSEYLTSTTNAVRNTTLRKRYTRKERRLSQQYSL